MAGRRRSDQLPCRSHILPTPKRECFPTPESAISQPGTPSVGQEKGRKTDGEAGERPNYSNPRDLSIPESATRRPDGGTSYLAPSGRVSLVLLFGTQSNIWQIANAGVGASDGDFSLRPILWAQLYTVGDVVEGYFIPRVYALLPDKSKETYRRMWGAIRGLVGEEEDRWRICTMDFERSSVGAIHHAFSHPGIAWCTSHMGKSHYRKAQELGLSGKYQAGDGFRRRVRALSASPFLPYEEVIWGIRTN